MNQTKILNKNKKKIIIIVSLILAIVILVTFFSTIGWRMFDFAFCSSIGELGGTAIKYDDKINISGTTISSAKRYTGYTYKIKDGKLYIGLRYSLFGFSSGSFNINIKTNQEITEVWLKDNDSEKQIKLLDKDGNVISGN